MVRLAGFEPTTLCLEGRHTFRFARKYAHLLGFVNRAAPCGPVRPESSGMILV